MHTALAGVIPAFCSNHGILTPAQWQACWQAGWQQPTTGAANAGAAAGHAGAPVLLIIIAGAIALWVASRLGGSRSTATSN